MPNLFTRIRRALAALIDPEPSTAAFNVGERAQTGDIAVGDVAAGNVYKETYGKITLSDDARLDGVAVAVNLGTIIYGRDPSEDERRRLAWYLEGVITRFADLPLRGLDERLSRGERIALPQVYIALATETMLEAGRGRPAQLKQYFVDDDPQKPFKPAYDPDYALPDAALYRIDHAVERGQPELILQRSQTAVQAVQRHQHLVLLGDPGGGKSTFLRHLAWGLALYELDPARAPGMAGWDGKRALLPVFMPLRTLAGRLARDGVTDSAIYAALRDEVHTYGTHQIDDALRTALDRGAALLFFDGLDEVPVKKTPTVADRQTTLQALRMIAQRYKRCGIVVTCRTRAFDDLTRETLGWPVETLTPFTMGQIRHFVAGWYSELVAKNQIDQNQAQRLGAALVAAITDPLRPRLRAMAGTPLLLTLMALVLYNKGELPRDRPQLYERILELLLGQWDQVRDGQSLGQALGKPEWDSSYIRPLLDRLSYDAHAAATSTDGRGRLDRGAVYTALIDFFKNAGVDGPGDLALRCLEYIEQRSGLLVPDGDHSFVFAHLTLQEHCAGREIALNTDDPVAVIMQRRREDRWREPIFLGLGVATPLVLDRVLNDLIEREEYGKPKSVVDWYRDLLLAAEIGQDRDWTYLRTRPQVRVERFQRELRNGLAQLLNDKSQPLPTAERVRAGFLLGDLGDPRFPVTLEQWQAELARAGEPDSYFCRVEPGEYIIGSSDDDPDADDTEKPQHRFTLTHPLLIARYPITNAQWQAWVAQGGQPSYSANDPDHNRPNQAIVRVNQLMSEAFCAWLTERLAGALPPGWVLRLPTEQEWEAAARGGDARRYPWGDDWRDDHAATEEDRETRGWRWNLPVGCYPAGAAPCGALDMAGNVWEWTTSVWQSYPGANKAFTDADWRVLRGGYYGSKRTNVRCGARGRLLPDVGNSLLYGNGFRIVVAPPLAH